MRYQNTTDIPTKLVSIAANHAIEHVAGGIEIDALELVNKKAGIEYGQFGWYFAHEKRVKLIVPQTWHRKKYRLKYTGLWIDPQSRVEWMVGVLAHEFRHAHQWQVAGKRNASLVWQEVDAEIAQLKALEKWREVIGEAKAAHALARSAGG